MSQFLSGAAIANFAIRGNIGKGSERNTIMAKATKNKKLIALTGATGFVGAHILDRALKEGHRVKAITRRPQQERSGLEWVAGDLHNKEALKFITREADVLIHCAGIVKARRVDEFHEVNTNTLAHILDLLAHRDQSAGDCHVIFVSSLTAKHPHISPYARSKFNAEEILKARGEKFPWTIVRPPAVYGPGDMEILKLFRAMKRGYAPVVGGVDKFFSLIHGRDLAAAILSILVHKTAIHKTLEPDDQKKGGYTVHDVAEAAAAEFGRPVRPLAVPEAFLLTLAFANEVLAFATGKAPIFSRHKVREMAHPDWVCDPKSHKAISNWRPEIGLKEGVRETVHWYRERNLL